jgi:uncharacterized protein (DUF433 family)
MRGEPTITGTTITISQILRLVAEGLSSEEIVDEFGGQIQLDDVRQALLFAANLAS